MSLKRLVSSTLGDIFMLTEGLTLAEQWAACTVSQLELIATVDEAGTSVHRINFLQTSFRSLRAAALGPSTTACKAAAATAWDELISRIDGLKEAQAQHETFGNIMP